MKIQRILPMIYGVITAGVIGVAVLSFMLKISTDRMDAYQEQRYASNLLADELRQSSDDLTRLARTYVLTGDARYEKMYWDVLAIRNGKKLRPDNYERIYWDLVLDDNGKPRPDTTKAVPLRELMERAGFTEAEFAKLAEAQKNSDGLVKTEEIAMNMVKGRYGDGSGNFGVKGTPDPETARTLMHDAAYHRTKASIMKPIGEFQKMLAERTKQVTIRSLKRTKTIFWALQSILLALFFSTALLFMLKKRQQELELELSRSLVAEVEERKRAEEEQRKSSDTLQALVHSSPLAIVTFDKDGNIGMWNPAAERMFGWRAEEVMGRPHPIVPEDKQDEFREFRESAMGGRTFTGRELLRLRKDGSHIGISVSTAPLRDAAGSITSVMSIITDITEIKRAEEEKLNLERQVQQAQKMESLGVLAGGIAHDFNNLLMVVLGHAELALKEISPMSPARGSITEIATAAHRAADLCRQMLAYAGKASFALERVGLRDLVEEMAHLLKTAISKKAILNLNLERGLPPIEADPSQLRQIVMNLLINASEAIGDRSGVITVSVGATRCDEEYLRKTELRDALSPGLYVHLEVTDTGGGMDAQTRSRIFEPFFSTKFTGRGLGLAAVLGIVRAHKGALKVVSEPGKGTTFKILFPTLEDAGEGARTNDSSPLADWRGKGTILLVDDEESLIGLGARMLEHLGFTVLTAADGLQAVERYRERGKEIDLVLMDLTMPHMDGAEAFGELRRLNPDVRVVLASGYSHEDVAARFAGKGLSGVLQKPYTLFKLRESLAGLMPGPEA